MATIQYPENRRRIRANQHIRELAATFHVSHKDFIQPLFVDETINKRTPVDGLSGVYSDSADTIVEQIGHDLQNGISKFLLFPIVTHKSESDFDYSFILNTLRKIKSSFTNRVWIAVDVCLCAYTSHGHCGVLNAQRNHVLNNESVYELANYALQLAKAGADCIAPSDMMDGRVKAIRKHLDDSHFESTGIMSYSSKFSSQFYGPFRQACKSSPDNNLLISDRKSYQISPFNIHDALLSAIRDAEEGADMVMVKPAVYYLDVIRELKQYVKHPVAAYHVSGEYQSIELLAQHGLAQREKTHAEVWASLKRAGADVIISYAARHSKKWIEQLEY